MPLSKEEIQAMVQLAVRKELEEREFLTRSQIADIAGSATKETMYVTLRLMGVRFKDNGEVDFEAAHENNDYVNRLRRGHRQATAIIFNSCIATAAIAFLTLMGSALWEHIRNAISSVPPLPK